MEKITGCITMEITPHFFIKTRLMLSPKLIGRCIILGFMLLVGFSIAKSIDAGSPLGLILAIVSLCAGIYFVHLLGKISEHQESS